MLTADDQRGLDLRVADREGKEEQLRGRLVLYMQSAAAKTVLTEEAVIARVIASPDQRATECAWPQRTSAEKAELNGRVVSAVAANGKANNGKLQQWIEAARGAMSKPSAGSQSKRPKNGGQSPGGFQSVPPSGRPSGRASPAPGGGAAWAQAHPDTGSQPPPFQQPPRVDDLGEDEDEDYYGDGDRASGFNAGEFGGGGFGGGGFDAGGFANGGGFGGGGSFDEDECDEAAAEDGGGRSGRPSASRWHPTSRRGEVKDKQALVRAALRAACDWIAASPGVADAGVDAPWSQGEIPARRQACHLLQI
mmetsp:Transcript_62924/g.172817  ORF Transcript_62924/g.172817 Transcript_62924/m.172817 type:complete len:307 (-) Transcript_62924:134-1054(-)